MEGFEDARVGNGSAIYLGTALDSASNNAVFKPGDILPGITFDNYFLPTTEPLVALGAGTLTGTSKLLGNGVADDALSIKFGPGVTSVALDLFAAASPGNSKATDEVITIFTDNGSINDTIDFHSVHLANITGGFFGVHSDRQIKGIRIDTQASYVEFADNVAFGTPAIVPEPSGVALLAVGALGLLGFARRRAR